MTEPFRLGCVQTNSGNDMAANLDAAEDLIRQAREAGADFIALPECVSMMEPDRALVRDKAAPADDHPAIKRFQALARDLDAWLLVGSVAIDSR